MVARPSLKRAVPGSVPPWRALCAELARALNLFCCSNPSSGRFRAFWVRPSCPRVGRRRGGAPPQLPGPSGRASAGGPGLVSFCERVFFVAPSLFRAAATFFVAAPRFSTSGNQEGAAAWSKRSWLCAAQNFQAGGALQLNANSKSSPSRWGCFMKRFSADVVSCAQKLAATLCPSVANSLPRSVVTTKFLSSPVSSRAARLVARPTVSAFLFCRGSTAAFWVKSMRSACSRSLGPSAADLPSARGRGACTCRPTSAFSASKAMACVASRSRCLASWYSFRGSRTLKSSARSLSASISKTAFVAPKKGPVLASLDAPKRSLSKVPLEREGLLTQLLVLRPRWACQASSASSRAWKPLRTPRSAGEVRVVEGNHLRAVAPPRGPRQILPLCFCEVVRGEAQPQVPVHVRALVLLGLHESKSCLSSATSASSSPGCRTSP